MAFKNANLSVIAYANGFTLWHYKTQDGIQDINEEYFTPVADLMAAGDIFILNCADFTGMRAIKMIQDKKVVLTELQ